MSAVESAGTDEIGAGSHKGKYMTRVYNNIDDTICTDVQISVQYTIWLKLLLLSSDRESSDQVKAVQHLREGG